MVNPPDAITLTLVTLGPFAFQKTDFADDARLVRAEQSFTDPGENKAALEEPIWARRAEHAAITGYGKNVTRCRCPVIEA